MEENIKSKLKFKSFNKKEKIIVATIILGIIFLILFVKKDAFNNIKLAGISVVEYMGSKSSTLEDYKDIINKDVSQNDVSIKLNEFVLDGNKIVISSTINSDKVKWKDSQVVLSPQVYINDKNIMADGGKGSSKQRKVDKSTYNLSNFLILNDKDLVNFKGNLHVKIVYDTIFNGRDELKGNWAFEFNYNKLLNKQIRN